MTESEWLVCDDANPMFHCLSKATRLTERKVRLFAVACCRRIAYWFTDPALGAALDVAERYADGLASEAELTAADQAALAVEEQLETEAEDDPARANAADAFYHAAKAVGQTVCLDHPDCRFIYRMRDTILHVAHTAAFAATADPWDREEDRHTAWGRAERTERRQLADLVREVFGNLFRTCSLDQHGLTSTVFGLAQAIYDERAFDQLPILADALEEAGCTDADILRHLRGPGPHARGCWSLDLLLGKE